MAIKLQNTHDFSNDSLTERLRARYHAYLVIEDPEGHETYRYVLPAGSTWMRYSVDLLQPDEKWFYMDGPLMHRPNPFRRLWLNYLNWKESAAPLDKGRLSQRFVGIATVLVGLGLILALVGALTEGVLVMLTPVATLAVLAVGFFIASVCVKP